MSYKAMYKNELARAAGVSLKVLSRRARKPPKRKRHLDGVSNFLIRCLDMTRLLGDGGFIPQSFWLLS